MRNRSSGSVKETAMAALSAIVEQLIDGPGFVLMPNLMAASEAAQARSRVGNRGVAVRFHVRQTQ